MTLRKNIVNVVAYLLLITSIFYFIYYGLKRYNLDRNQTEELTIFFNNYNNEGNKIDIKNTDNSYLMVLEIPKINLKQGIYNKDNYKNNIDFNVSILKESSFPDNMDSPIILAAHSGNSIVSYFKNLKNLEKYDEVFIYYQGKKYNYYVQNIHNQNKDISFSLEKNLDYKLILITCLNNYEYLIIGCV